jgi:hypothetical protein
MGGKWYRTKEIEILPSGNYKVADGFQTPARPRGVWNWNGWVWRYIPSDYSHIRGFTFTHFNWVYIEDDPGTPQETARQVSDSSSPSQKEAKGANLQKQKLTSSTVQHKTESYQIPLNEAIAFGGKKGVCIAVTNTAKGLLTDLKVGGEYILFDVFRSNQIKVFSQVDDSTCEYVGYLAPLELIRCFVFIQAEVDKFLGVYLQQRYQEKSDVTPEQIAERAYTASMLNYNEQVALQIKGQILSRFSQAQQ